VHARSFGVLQLECRARCRVTVSAVEAAADRGSSPPIQMVDRHHKVFFLYSGKVIGSPNCLNMGIRIRWILRVWRAVHSSWGVTLQSGVQIPALELHVY
jgi:hypothetical protein